MIELMNITPLERMEKVSSLRCPLRKYRDFYNENKRFGNLSEFELLQKQRMTLFRKGTFVCIKMGRKMVDLS